MLDPFKSEGFRAHGTEPWGWLRIIHIPTRACHAVPTWDIKPHIFSEGCACGTTVEDEMVLHTAWDGREVIEAGGRTH